MKEKLFEENVLRLLRVLNDVSQTELSEKIGRSKPHISQIESGKTKIGLKIIEQYSKTFGVKTSELVQLSEDSLKVKEKERREFLRKSLIGKLYRKIENV
jgi:transcriptional regulator with XRE-family HTH domain